ncbi:dihydrofolate reductase [Porphyromonas crevioricanis]|uniref:2-hydroxyacid dehydrogenase SAV2305 n=2 Tax=Porphyromonas crevioricanis TaxID=393921 RepID=A0A0A2FR93_9PORP|nr:NAD(P)-dependent oxidoreductase [Porphyromonas crevioricanis]KGN90764.1 dihydrofolate reductase [Porphyromonas crevioricanis]KGN93993.1 dihydrofolate reductase [Porphyromonas crevioricanis]SJZ62736.1 Lactate dehydrogenase [Porphyromonas crevioricanis]SQH72872.1 Putative 2-hydroxyacid dehydrogenase SAV2305 [Porphyromonas crevioricanis]GAD05765.1 hydroxypyruvate reductase [Porphyromonas crevioricanis JCM 15906]
MAKILIAFDTVEEGFEELKRKHELTFPPKGRDFSREELLEMIPEYEVLCSVFDIPVDSELIERGSQLRLIANYAVGYNNIDLAAAARRSIVVCNTPHAVVEPTADLALALLLGCTRRICEWDKVFRCEREKVDRGRLSRLGSNLYGKTIGILGFGNIGAAVARRCKAFGMKVLYNKRHRLDPLDEERLDIEYIDKEELLRRSDVISLHTPYTPDTHHYIGQKEFEMMKPSAILINTSRGAVVDEHALVAALRTNLIAAAGLDVFEFHDEPLPELYDLPNVCLTPHIGTQTYDSRVEMAVELCNNVLGFLDGDRPYSRVPMPQ